MANQDGAVGKAKPYKLKPPYTRDAVLTWNYNMRAFIKQNQNWRQFMRGGAHEEWTATKHDETNGLAVQDAAGARNDAETTQLRDHFENFITCVATHCPQDFFSTVVEESTSYNWVVATIEKTFELQTKGEHFLRGAEIKVSYGDGMTYGQGFMRYLAFYRDTLLKTGDTCEGVARTTNEELTPMALHFIMEKWLVSIDPRLPAHILRTRGSGLAKVNMKSQY